MVVRISDTEVPSETPRRTAALPKTGTQPAAPSIAAAEADGTIAYVPLTDLCTVKRRLAPPRIVSGTHRDDEKMPADAPPVSCDQCKRHGQTSRCAVGKHDTRPPM